MGMAHDESFVTNAGSVCFQWMVGGALHFKGIIPFWGVGIYPVCLYFTPWALLRGRWRLLFLLPKKQRCDPAVNLPVSHWLSWLQRLCSHTICFPTLPVRDENVGIICTEQWRFSHRDHSEAAACSVGSPGAPVYRIPMAISLCLECRCQIPVSCVWYRGFPEGLTWIVQWDGSSLCSASLNCSFFFPTC